MMVRRGQSGIEFLAVTGIGLVLLLGVSFFLLSDSKTSRDQATLQQAQAAGNEILAQSRVVLSLGKNSWTEVTAQLPQGVGNVYTVENNTLVFEIDTINGPMAMPLFSEVPIQGWYTQGQRSYLADTSGATSSYARGQVRFTVYSNGTHVLLCTNRGPTYPPWCRYDLASYS